jgi:hypothetical protein
LKCCRVEVAHTLGRASKSVLLAPLNFLCRTAQFLRGGIKRIGCIDHEVFI